jgi:hypothetical protein
MRSEGALKLSCRTLYYGEDKIKTEWETADSIPDHLIWERLCDDGRASNGVACIECKVCAYGRKYVRLYAPTPQKIKPIYTPKHTTRLIKAFMGDKLIGEWTSYRAATEAVNASTSTIFYAVKRGSNSGGMRFLMEEVGA